MDKIAKRELANAILDTLRIHEASFEQTDPRGWGFHRKDLLESAQEAGVDRDLQPIVGAMVGFGFSDFAIWATEFLASETVAS